MVSSIVFAAFGAAVARLLGLRTALLLVVAATPTGIAALVLAAQVVGVVGIRTTIWIDALVALAAATGVGVARQFWMRRAPQETPARDAPGRIRWAGAAVGALVALGVWLGGIGDFAIPPQGNDDIWHGYLVERLTLMQAITAATVAPAYADSATPIVYYQYGLHLSAALVHELTGVSVAGALNGAWTVFVGLLLPFGVAALAWRLFPAHPWVAFWSAALSTSFTIFPYLTNGILPYTAALAMVPGVLALVLAMVDRVSVPAAVVALAGLGVFVTHPSAAVAAAVLGVLVTIDRLVRPSITRDRLPAVRQLVVVGALGIILSSPWLLASGDVGLSAPGGSASVTQVAAAGVDKLLGLASPWTPPQPLLAVMAWLGVLASLASRRAIGFTLAFLLFSALYVGALGGAEGIAGIPNPWHGDWHRLVAVVGLLAPVVAGLGVTTVIRHSRSLLARIGDRRTHAVLVAVALIIGASAVVRIPYDAAHAQSIVRTAWHSPRLVTDHDIDLLRDLANRLGPADKVLNSPVDGSSWMYALFETVPVSPYSGGSNLNLPDVYGGQGVYADRGVVCRTLAATGATYALVKTVRGNDGGDNYDIARLVSRYPELFTLILRSESSSAYRIEAVELARCARA